MQKSNTLHTERFTIRANEVDVNGNLTLFSLCHFFQEVAGNNAKDLSFDITDLQDQDMTWVLHRMDIKINAYPKWRDTITIETWPAAGDTLRAFRNYRVLNQEGIELGCCLSYWMMINLKTRRPVRMPQSILDTRFTKRQHVLEVKSNRISKIETLNPTSFNVRRSDTDMNLHVNNATYINWMLDSIPLEKAQSLSDFDIIYMNESVEGDTVSSVFENAMEKTLRFQLTNQDGKVIALAEALTKSN